MSEQSTFVCRVCANPATGKSKLLSYASIVKLRTHVDNVHLPQRSVTLNGEIKDLFLFIVC